MNSKYDVPYYYSISEDEDGTFYATITCAGFVKTEDAEYFISSWDAINTFDQTHNFTSH
jgi:hypothetical protein